MRITEVHFFFIYSDLKDALMNEQSPDEQKEEIRKVLNLLHIAKILKYGVEL